MTGDRETLVQAVRIELQPVGEQIRAERGTPLREILPAYGVEFPCGGRGLCDGCRVKVLKGDLPITPDQEEILSPEELSEGWRLMCRCGASEDVTLDIAQWDPVILGDHADFSFTPESGLGVAVDVGTTTLVAQLLDLRNGRVLAVRSSLNPQVGFGSDVMSRLQHGLDPPSGQKLTSLIRDEVGELIQRLFDLQEFDTDQLRRVVIVGNTVMHHIFCGLDLEPLSRVPFESPHIGLQRFGPRDLGWALPDRIAVEFLPALGGFVGSDILAGILVTRMHLSEKIIGLIDLGTNGEIAFGNSERIICASTAAGPAFEAGGIRQGMRASLGAISQVRAGKGRFDCRVIGDIPAQGICGSGVVDAVAAALEMGLIQPNGRITGKKKTLELTSTVRLTQRDIRELQLAKGAVAAGVRIILQELGCSPTGVDQVFLAGAFGNYISRSSAERIGLFEVPINIVKPLGNTALKGAKLALFEADHKDREFSAERNKLAHRSLASSPKFQERFAEAMMFP